MTGCMSPKNRLGDAPVERDEDIDNNEPGDLSPEDERLADGLLPARAFEYSDQNVKCSVVGARHLAARWRALTEGKTMWSAIDLIVRLKTAMFALDAAHTVARDFKAPDEVVTDIAQAFRDVRRIKLRLEELPPGEK
jgi:hypothetical protein